MAKRTYQINYLCQNCGEKGTIDIPYGEYVSSTVCPNCGCRSITSISKSREPYYMDGTWKDWLKSPTAHLRLEKGVLDVKSKRKN